jgi:hypothetical protein
VKLKRYSQVVHVTAAPALVAVGVTRVVAWAGVGDHPSFFVSFASALRCVCLFQQKTAAEYRCNSSTHHRPALQSSSSPRQQARTQSKQACTQQQLPTRYLAAAELSSSISAPSHSLHASSCPVHPATHSTSTAGRAAAAAAGQRLSAHMSLTRSRTC